ncbi:hypothetical protein WJX77_006184 [Trebouxia sp. C0004]
MSGMEQRAGQALNNQGNKLENRAQTGNANAGPNPTSGNQGYGGQQGGAGGQQGGFGGQGQGVPSQGVGGQGGVMQQGGGMQGGGMGARGPQGGMQGGMPQQGGGGGGVSGSYETHRHKDDLDEKGSYQSN